MAGIGTVVNVLAILAGGCAGLVLKGGLKARYQQAVIQAMGLCIIFIGGAGTLNGMLSVRDGVLTGLDTRGTLGMILALAAGSLLGEWLDLDGRMERLGGWLKEKASRGEDSQFIQGFVTASLTVCVGAMAIVGSIQDGMTGDPSTLFTKSVLDLRQGGCLFSSARRCAPGHSHSVRRTSGSGVQPRCGEQSVLSGLYPHLLCRRQSCLRQQV